MSCSKILSGDLPELVYEIIKNFQNDYSTLHSCILVNKFWCQIAIPLLWKDPFSMKNPKNFHFIEIYLQKINEKDKTQLNRCGINNKKIRPFEQVNVLLISIHFTILEHIFRVFIHLIKLE